MSRIANITVLPCGWAAKEILVVHDDPCPTPSEHPELRGSTLLRSSMGRAGGVRLTQR